MSLTRLTGIWRIAQPFYEGADGIGAGAPAVSDQPPPSDDSGSLSDHEAEFSPDAHRTEPDPETPDAASDRDEKGQFKPRHRASSQRASAEDVPRIKELTAKWRTAETERETLARELAELKARPAAQTPEPPQAKAPAASQQAASQPSEEFDFPDYDKWEEANPGKDWNVYRRAELNAYADWRDSRANIDGRIAQTIAQRDAARELRTVVDGTHAKGREAYTDFDAILTSGPGASVDLHTDPAKASERVTFIFRHPQSEHLQYAIMKDADLAHRLAGLDDIGFGLELSTLVTASQRSPDTRAAGSAPALVRPPAPRPPNPVRTGPSRSDTDVPGDDATLAEHERAFGPRRR